MQDAKKMRVNLFLSIALFLSFFSISVYAADIRITDINIEKTDTSNRVIIHLDKELSSSPALHVRPNIIQLEIPNTYVWPKIEKQISLDGNPTDAKMTAYQFEQEVVRFRVITPYEVGAIQDQISILDRGRRIEVVFPRTENDILAESNLKRPSQQVVQKDKRNKRVDTSARSKDDYDESYLEQLLKERSQNPAQESDDFALEDEKEEDEVTMTLAAGDSFGGQEARSGEGSFSFMGYIGKFVAFLGLVLVLFYGIVSVLKKGVLRRGRLSLLNDTNVVEVLNTTYVGPKRSLMLVKAHKQVFLVASCEKGFEFLSEVKDVSGLFKDGEKTLAGDNFDTSLDSAKEGNQSFKLKEVASQDAGLAQFLKNSGNSQEAATQEENYLTKSMRSANSTTPEDRVKLSDQIKNKVKGLKPLQ